MVAITEVTTPAPRQDWDAVIRGDADALVTQTPAWIDAMVETGTFRDRSRLYKLEDGRRFVLPLARRVGAAGAVLGDQGFPNGWGFGGLVGGGIDSDVVAAVFADLHSNGSARTQIRPNPLHGDFFRNGAPSAAIALPRRAHVIDIAGGADDVWKRFSKAARRAVRKGEATGFDIESGSSERLAREYYALHLLSVERWAQMQHEPLRLARLRAEHRDGLAKWLAIGKALGPNCQFSVARHDGRPVGAMVLLRGPNGHETRSAFDHVHAAKTSPVYLLTWLGIQESLATGARWYHLGETGSSTRLADFKERFAAVGYDYADYRLERFPITRTDALARSMVKRAIRFRD